MVSGRPYLSWAITNTQDANAISAAGIKTMFYSDPNRQTPNSNMWTSDETTFAHDCSGNRITLKYNNVVLYVMNPASPSIQSLWHNVVAATAAQAHFDAVYEDDAGKLQSHQTQPAAPCNYDDQSWINADSQMEAAAGLPVIANALSMYNNGGMSLAMALFNNATTSGGDHEHCYSTYLTQPKIGDWIWRVTENTELAVARLGRIFNCSARTQTAASSSTDARIYVYASFLLTYDPSTSMLDEQFATPSHFRVEPESQLVALNPEVAPPSTVDALQISGGVYAREYRACYFAGQKIGRCAAVVNPSLTAAYAWPYGTKYKHTMVLNGGGVLDGGAVSLTGGPPPSTVGPLEATIAFL